MRLFKVEVTADLPVSTEIWIEAEDRGAALSRVRESVRHGAQWNRRAEPPRVTSVEVVDGAPSWPDPPRAA